MPTKITVDAKDRAIMVALRADARLSNVDLGRLVGLSEGAVRGRLSWLEGHGYIRGYCALIQPGVIERAPLVWARFSISAADEQSRERFETGLRALACVLELDRLKAQSTYILRANHENIGDLISALALSAGVIARDIEVMPAEAPVAVVPIARQSGTSNQSGYEGRS